jgi:nucleoside 2-deoxyribosyltransferase
MRVYLAAGFSHKDEIAEKTRELQALGVQVTSTWPWEEVKPATQLHEVSEEYLTTHAQRDINEINEADTIILFTQESTKPFCRGGRMHEFGYAHAAGKQLIVIGPRENIFHYLPTVTVYPSWETLILEIRPQLKFEFGE